MKSNLKNDSVWLGYSVEIDPKNSLKPNKIRFWSQEKFSAQKPTQPFHYFSDALTGLSSIRLNSHFKNPFGETTWNFTFCSEAWQNLEPHLELYKRSQIRVNALRNSQKPLSPAIAEYFERNFSDTLDASMHTWGIDLNHLSHLIEAIDYLESKMEQPLLYNFRLKLERETIEKLHSLQSLLFNLRALVGLEFNNKCQDPTYEACKVDSITDYLPKAEYVANDAILYYQFLKQKNFIKPEAQKVLLKSFKGYSHNGYCLIESLPSSFLKNLRIEELEESLYLVQMDWLLGSEAGLLFRIREELYGLLEGYQKVFWLEASPNTFKSSRNLDVSCFIDLQTLYPKNLVAS